MNICWYIKSVSGASLEEKFVREGGFRENLFKKRIMHKNKQM